MTIYAGLDVSDKATHICVVDGDTSGRLTSQSDDLAGSGYDQTRTYGYNPAPQIVTRSTSNDLYAFMGNYNVDRLLAIKCTPCICARRYAVNGLNQYNEHVSHPELR